MSGVSDSERIDTLTAALREIALSRPVSFDDAEINWYLHTVYLQDLAQRALDGVSE